jgi:hypothetical protein
VLNPLRILRRFIVTSTSKDTQKKTTLGDADITSVRTQTRRTFLRRTGMVGLAVIGAGVAAPRPAVAADAIGAGSDSDVNDPYGAGSDNDANDPYGAGTDYDVAPSSSSSDLAMEPIMTRAMLSALAQTPTKTSSVSVNI